MDTSQPGFWIALWGGVLSTILAVLRLREFFTDRGQLKFSATVQRTLNPSPPGDATTHQPDPSGPRVVFTVTNVGRRKLRVMGFGVRTAWYWKRPRKRDRELCPFLSTDFPRDLGEGETMQFDDPVYAGQLRNPRVVAAFVYDSLGKRWEMPKSSLGLARDPARFELPPELLRRR